MAKRKQETNPSAFDGLFDMYGNSDEVTSATNLDEDTVAEDDVTTIEEPAGEEPDEEDNDTKEAADTEPADKEQSIETEAKTETTEVDDTEPTDEDVAEAQQVGVLFDAVAESLGWDIADISDEERPLTVEGLTKYLTDVVQQNSVPQYADDRIQKLDEFVKNGGKFEDFYQVQKQALSLDNIDLELESNQRTVIEDLLRHNGYTEEQINNKIARYEDAGVLYEESEDALEMLKDIRKKEAEANAKQQEELAKQQEAQQQQFMKSVTDSINSLDSIRGISIPKADRKALYDYIFKTDKDGYTQYQKDFDSNLAKNLIESAYFTMKGDAVVSTAKKTGETSAAEKLRKLLRNSAKNHTSQSATSKEKSVTDLLDGMF